MVEERKKRHHAAYKKIKKILRTSAFSFRIHGENGDTSHVLRLTISTAERLGLPPLIEDGDPAKVFEKIDETLRTGTNKEVVSNA